MNRTSGELDTALNLIPRGERAWQARLPNASCSAEFNALSGKACHGDVNGKLTRLVVGKAGLPPLLANPDGDQPSIAASCIMR